MHFSLLGRQDTIGSASRSEAMKVIVDFGRLKSTGWGLDILSGLDSSERQRRSETEPKVGAKRLPWVEGTNEMSTPTGLCPIAPSDLMWAKPIDK